MAKKGDWVQIHKVLLKPGQRASNLPKDTKKVPLEVFLKGYLQEDADIGEAAACRAAYPGFIRFIMKAAKL